MGGFVDAGSSWAGDASLARIAEDVGYQTDTAFSRAFRREYGLPPAAWRKRRAGSGLVAGLNA